MMFVQCLSYPEAALLYLYLTDLDQGLRERGEESYFPFCEASPAEQPMGQPVAYSHRYYSLELGAHAKPQGI